MTQTPPLLSRLIQGYLDHTGIEACPYHQMDHGVRDPDCDHCKRALAPLYHHKIVGNRHLPVFTFDFSGPHPHRVNMAQHLLSLGLEPRPYEINLGVWRGKPSGSRWYCLAYSHALRIFVRSQEVLDLQHLGCILIRQVSFWLHMSKNGSIWQHFVLSFLDTVPKY